MADVKWIKLAVDIFSHRKIRQIRLLPDGDTIALIWIQLLCLAGVINDYGMIYLTKEIPYTVEMLASECSVNPNTMKIAISVFQQWSMIEPVGDFFRIVSWEKYQNIDGLEKIQEQNRLRQKKWYDKQKCLMQENEPNVRPNVRNNVTPNVIVTLPNATEEKRIEENREEENITPSNEGVYPTVSQSDVQMVVDAWNNAGLTNIRVCNRRSNRGKMLYQRLQDYGVCDVLQAIENASNSNFLRGQNNNNWVITFDWFVKPNNFLKVLEGNYNNRVSVASTAQKSWDDIARELEEERCI